MAKIYKSIVNFIIRIVYHFESLKSASNRHQNSFSCYLTGLYRSLIIIATQNFHYEKKQIPQRDYSSRICLQVEVALLKKQLKADVNFSCSIQPMAILDFNFISTNILLFSIFEPIFVFFL